MRPDPDKKRKSILKNALANERFASMESQPVDRGYHSPQSWGENLSRPERRLLERMQQSGLGMSINANPGRMNRRSPGFYDDRKRTANVDTMRFHLPQQRMGTQFPSNDSLFITGHEIGHGMQDPSKRAIPLRVFSGGRSQEMQKGQLDADIIGMLLSREFGQGATMDSSATVRNLQDGNETTVLDMAMKREKYLRSIGLIRDR